MFFSCTGGTCGEKVAKKDEKERSMLELSTLLTKGMQHGDSAVRCIPFATGHVSNAPEIPSCACCLSENSKKNAGIISQDISC